MAQINRLEDGIDDLGASSTLLPDGIVDDPAGASPNRLPDGIDDLGPFMSPRSRGQGVRSPDIGGPMSSEEEGSFFARSIDAMGGHLRMLEADLAAAQKGVLPFVTDMLGDPIYEEETEAVQKFFQDTGGQILDPSKMFWMYDDDGVAKVYVRDPEIEAGILGSASPITRAGRFVGIASLVNVLAGAQGFSKAGKVVRVTKNPDPAPPSANIAPPASMDAAELMGESLAKRAQVSNVADILFKASKGKNVDKQVLLDRFAKFIAKVDPDGAEFPMDAPLDALGKPIGKSLRDNMIAQLSSRMNTGGKVRENVGARAVQDMYDKYDIDKAAREKVTVGRLLRDVQAKTTDRQGLAKARLRQAGPEGEVAVMRLEASAGAPSYAGILARKWEKLVYSGLDKDNTTLLDRVIQNLRNREI